MFSLEKLKSIAAKLKTGEALGLDGTLQEILKIVLKTLRILVLNVVNHFLKPKHFHTSWKKSKVVGLIPNKNIVDFLFGEADSRGV